MPHDPTAEIDHPATDSLPSAPQVVERRWSVRQTFNALKYRNYRLWFFGQMVSLMGSWMQVTAQGFLMYELTNSPAYLGLVGFAAGVPSWLFMLYGGVVADRVSRRNLMLVTQSIMMCLAFILAALTFSGLVQPWHIIVLALALGTANAFDAPARVSFLLELVEREDITNAVALNGTMFNSATAVGPAVAGLTYALVGPAWCFAINGVSFLGILGALALMRLRPRPPAPPRRPALVELAEGVRFAAGHPIIRTLILLVSILSLFGLSFATLLPAWSVKILGGDATTNGLLQSARGVGALGSALFVASLGRFSYRGKLITLGSFIFPTLILVFAAMRWLPLSLAALVGAGWGLILIMNLGNAMVQTLVPDALRGRVLSIYTLTFFGLMPIGALFAGFTAQLVGEPLAVAFSALVSLAAAAVVFVRVPQLRAMP